MSQQPPLVTSPQFAARISRSPRTVHRLVKDHRITPAMTVGTGPNAAMLFYPEDVEALAREIEAKRKTASAA